MHKVKIYEKLSSARKTFKKIGKLMRIELKLSDSRINYAAGLPPISKVKPS